MPYNHMAFDTVYLVSKTLDLATAQAVAAAEAALGIRFPAGYREYVTTLGAGHYNDDIRIMMPEQIQAEYAVQQQTWAEYADLYEGYYEVIPPDRLVQSIIFGTTSGGLDIIFHPDDPEDIYVLNAEDEDAFHAGATLEGVLDWMVLSGEVLWKDDPAVLTRSGEFVSTDFRYFESHLNRAQLHLSGSGPSSFRQARDYLIARARATPDVLTCVRHHEECDGEPPLDWIQLLVSEYAGDVRCFDAVEGEGSSIDLRYDRTQQTAALRDLVAALTSFGYRSRSSWP